MRWDGGSISWSKIIRGAIASSITDSPSIEYRPFARLFPRNAVGSRPNTERPGRLQTFTFRDRLFTSLRHQTVFLSEEQFRNLLETKVRKESVNMHQEWEEAYRAAVLETDHNKLMDKIDSATTVLRKSLLEASSPPEHIGERQRIEDALRTLDMIRRIELQIPP